MNEYLLLTGIVLTICILSYRFLEKLEVPSLLLFIALGMLFGVNGLFGIPFDNYQASEVICSISLIFIMFYGGFGANVKAARPVAGRAVLLSTAGVALTAGLVGVFSHYCLHLPWLESFLTGSVISSTDAASVFHILRSKKLNLKDNTASLLELESGSNDPVSYMLTSVLVLLMTGEKVSVPLMLAAQLGLGLLFGLLIGKAALWVLNRFAMPAPQGGTIFILAAVVLAYALPSVTGGNGYLGVYICGIVMGNSYLPEKRDTVHFFDALTGIAQMMIFFLLGLLVTPQELPAVLLPALLTVLFLTFAARPAAVFALLLPSGSSLRQAGLVSWAGLRGAASIVFAIMAVLKAVPLRYNLFNLVFCIVLFSIALQGTLLRFVSRKLQMIDDTADVRKTFNDYREESEISFVEIHVKEGHPWSGRRLKELPVPREFLVVLIMRGDGRLVPDGGTQVLPGDLLVLAAQEFEDRENLTMQEIVVDRNHRWKDRRLKELKDTAGSLIVMIRRKDETVIPDGDTVLREGDTLAVARFFRSEERS